MNAQVKRFFRSLRAECLDGMTFVGEKMLCCAIGQFVTHYHVERNHQGLGNRLIEPGEEVDYLDVRSSVENDLAGYCSTTIVTPPELTKSAS